MVDGAGEYEDSRIISSHVTKFPAGFDMENDIFTPGKVEEFQRQLTSALRTRGLLRPLQERETTLQEMIEDNEDEKPEDIVKAYDAIISDRTKAFGTVADHLMSTIKTSSLQLYSGIKKVLH
jgi:hypothetical protein